MSKQPPKRATLQWLWPLMKETYTKPIASAALDPKEIVASTHAKACATDNRVDLRWVTGTGSDGRITKENVLQYVKDGKPVPEQTEIRYPTRGEIISEICRAMMLVTDRLKATAVFVWMDVTFLEDEETKRPVITIEWYLTGGRSRAGRLKDYDKRFGLIAPRAENPWDKDGWGPKYT